MPDDIPDTAPNLEDVNYDELSEFFEKKGAVELISLLMVKGIDSTKSTIYSMSAVGI